MAAARDSIAYRSPRGAPATDRSSALDRPAYAGRESRVGPDRLLEAADGVLDCLPADAAQPVTPPEICLVRGAVLRSHLSPGRLDARHRHGQRPRHLVGNLPPEGDHVFESLIVRLRPEMAVGLCVDQLERDPDPVARPLDRALEHVTHAQRLRDLGDGEALGRQGDHGGSRDDLEIPNLGELGDDLLGEALAQKGGLAVTAVGGERHDRDRRTIRRCRGLRGIRGGPGRGRRLDPRTGSPLFPHGNSVVAASAIEASAAAASNSAPDLLPRPSGATSCARARRTPLAAARACASGGVGLVGHRVGRDDLEGAYQLLDRLEPAGGHFGDRAIHHRDQVGRQLGPELSDGGRRRHDMVIHHDPGRPPEEGRPPREHLEQHAAHASRCRFARPRRARPSACSGLMYAGVPIGSPAMVRDFAAAGLDRARDAEVRHPACPSASRMFSGLMSRWMTPCPCA